MTPLVLIACSKQKLPVPSPAKDLYQGSLFKKCRQLVERDAMQWVIISARHGIIDPRDTIAPYDATLEKMGRRERLEWAGMVQTQLRTLHTGRQLVALAGEHYRTALAGFDVRIPLFGLGIGEQLHALSNPNFTLLGDRT